MIIAEVSYLRDDGFLFSRNTLHKKYAMYKKSFVMIGGCYPSVCYLPHRIQPLIPFLDQKNHSNSDKITKCFVRVRQDYF
jgi:hypothetical protein